MIELKHTFRDASHAARRGFERLKTWFEPPLDAASRPLEIREAIVEEVERRVEPAAAGRRLLPHNHVIVVVAAEHPEDRAAVETALADVGETIRMRLTELRCPVPPGFDVEVQVVKRPRAGWRPEQRFAVEYSSRPVTRAAPARSPLPTLRLAVVRGTSSESLYCFAEPHVRIGRSETPVDHRGQPRQNDVVFLEDGDAHSSTVGRAHASIRFDPNRGEYRLFDDGSHNGTRVLRAGTTVTVAPRNPVGVTILSGDELQFGTAAVRVEIE